ncbi:MAG TPA: hypothetical protein PL072_12400, partial [Phycisphaerales bacterium]|nr:hypothetical protein [Phycisphaerales bacterium]
MRSLIWSVLCLVMACAVARAQSSASLIPPVRTGTPTVTVSPESERLVIKDAATQEVVFDQQNMPMWQLWDPRLQASVRRQVQPDGVDLIYTFTNPTDEALPIGELVVGNFNMGSEIEFRSAHNLNNWNRTRSGPQYGAPGGYYPRDTYSPVWVMRNDRHVIGISLLYPLLEYKHDIQIVQFTWTQTPQPCTDWAFYIGLSNRAAGGPLRFDARIPAGQTRVYTVTVRVENDRNDWLHTLVPYRDFFRSLYGGVAYTRDTRPVMPQSASMGNDLSASNPFGYVGGPQARPDLHGWGPWINNVLAKRPDWARFMVWAPSGMFNAPQSLELNYPYQFTTNWLSDPQTATATDPTNGLPRIKNAGCELGLWWGRSLQLMRQWNPTSWESFDPDNPEHRALALAEMDLAVAAGATCIGLDTFVADTTPSWKVVEWLQTMRTRYPSVKFITEPLQFDVMHRLAGSFLLISSWGGPPDVNNLFPLKEPLLLADFLLPGHETWGAYAYTNHRALGVFPSDPADQNRLYQRDAERIASF